MKKKGRSYTIWAKFLNEEILSVTISVERYSG